MNCEETRLLFSDFYDRDLSEEIRALVRQHLVSCAECQDEYENFKKALKILKKFKTRDVPRDYMTILKKRRENKTLRKRNRKLSPP